MDATPQIVEGGCVQLPHGPTDPRLMRPPQDRRPWAVRLGRALRWLLGMVGI